MGFKDAIQGNVEPEKEPKKEVKEEVNVEEPVFTLSVKKTEKPNTKTFNVYMENDMVKQLDKLTTKTKRSRNEIINIMVSWCLDNMKIE